MKATEKKREVLYVITKGNWGGAQKYVYDLSTAAAAAGFDVSVAVGGHEMQLVERLAEAGINTARLPTVRNEISPGAFVDAFLELRKLFKQRNPHTVHLNSSLAGAAGALAARSAGVPQIIFTAHGWAFNEDRSFLIKLLIIFFHYLTVLLSHTTVCNSAATRRDARFMPFVQHKITTIRLGATEPHFLEMAEARRRLVPDAMHSFVIGMIGELHRNKGVFEALEAFARVRSEVPEALLVIIGDGVARHAIETRIAELALQERVRLIGAVPDAASYLKAFDIFFFPSRTESLGYALIEAGYAALPAVATNVGGIPEILADGSGGVLVARADVPAMAEALVALARDPHRRQRSGGALRARVLGAFSPERMIKDTLALYHHTN